MLRIVMDSAGDLPTEWLNEYDIHIIPVNIHFGEQMFRQGVDLTNDFRHDLCRGGGCGEIMTRAVMPTPSGML